MDTTLSAPVAQSQSGEVSIWRVVFSGQARLLARRVEAGLPITSGSVARLVRLAERLDVELLEGQE